MCWMCSSSWRTVIPAREKQSGATPRMTAHPSGPSAAPLSSVDQKKLDIPADALLCSLEHEVKITEL